MRIVITESQLTLLEKYISNDSNILMEQIFSKFLNVGKNLSKLGGKTINAIDRLGSHLELKGLGKSDIVVKKLFNTLNNNFDEVSKTFKFIGGTPMNVSEMDKILGILSNENVDNTLKETVLNELKNLKLKNGNNLGDELMGIKTKKPTTPSTGKVKSKVGLTPQEKIIEKTRIMNETKSLKNYNERHKWYLDNKDLFNEVFKTEKEIEEFFKVTDNPDWKSIKKLIKEYDPSKSGGKNFYSWVESKGYNFPENIQNKLKKLTIEKQIEFWDLVKKGITNRTVVISLIGLTTTATLAWGVYEVVAALTEAGVSEITEFAKTDMVLIKKVNNILLSDNFKDEKGKNIKALNPGKNFNSIIVDVYDLKNDIVKLDTPLKWSDLKNYEFFRVFKNTLLPFDINKKIESNTTPTIEEFGLWFKNQPEFKTLDKIDQEIISFRMKDKSYEAYLPEEKGKYEESIEGTYNWDGKNYVKI